MKKIIPVVAIVIIGGGVFYFITSSTSLSSVSKSNESHSEAATKSGLKNTMVHDIEHPGTGGGSAIAPGATPGDDTDDSQFKSATESYLTAEDALKAIKNGAADYDDRILEQFTEVPEDCSWCKELYAQVKDLMLSPQTPKEQRGYYAELLAISGRVENVASLVEAIKAAPNQETQDALSEALELTVGKGGVTQYLGDALSGASDSLKESLIAAITNQGSRQAAEILYKATTEKGDPDGFYSSGIGLGELVPDEASMPYIQELMLKRDQYSHLAVKSLLNNGLDGLKLVMSSLSNSSNPEFDEKLIKGAAEHVPFDDDIKEYLQKIVETEKDPLKLKLAKAVLDSSNKDEILDTTGDAATADAQASATPASPALR